MANSHQISRLGQEMKQSKMTSREKLKIILHSFSKLT